MKLLGLSDKFLDQTVVDIYKGFIRLSDGREITALYVELNLDQIKPNGTSLTE